MNIIIFALTVFEPLWRSSTNNNKSKEIAKACALRDNRRSHAKRSTQVHATLFDDSSSHGY